MTKRTHESEGRTVTSPKPLAPTALEDTARQKWQAIRRIADELLSHLEQRVREDATAIVGRETRMLPCEVQDKQTYFLEKIEHARNTISQLACLVPTTEQPLDPRQVFNTELMILFVLVDAYRPDRFAEAGWKIGERTRNAMLEKIDSVSLDIFNMRERLK